MFKNNKYTKTPLYKWTIAVLAITAIILIILDFAAIIDINGKNSAWFWLNNIILVIFAVDYFWQLHLAHDKKYFFKTHIVDLLAIIPVGIAFNWMEIAQVSNIYLYFRLLRLIRLAGLIGKLREIFHTNGILYLLYFCIAFLMLGSVAFSITEHVPLNQAFWWAITTASTVGYSDISTSTIVPKTLMGQFVILVMIFIGVGIMGLVSSSLTTYFMRKMSSSAQSETQQTLSKIVKRLDQLQKQNHDLMKENIKLREDINEIKEKTNDKK